MNTYSYVHIFTHPAPPTYCMRPAHTSHAPRGGLTSLARLPIMGATTTHNPKGTTEMTAATARHEWNTGRHYTAEGQRIVAEVTATGVNFFDMSRGIYGTVTLPTYSTLSDTASVRSHVMGRYDRNEYKGGEEAYNFFLRCNGYA